jgi:hypothetical protein
MGTSVLDNQFRFNGVVSTDLTVMQNLENMCSAASSWLTYDSIRGQWAVIINRAGTSVASFDDSNILGSISVTTSGITELYNSVRVNFPHVDINDVRDFVRYEIPQSDFFPGEPVNELVIEYDIFNDPVQADLLAIRQLKQSRQDLSISFTTDFDRMGVAAGDIVDVTNTAYGFDHRLFRVVSVTETDSDDGSILLDITAHSYSDSVYDLSDLERYSRSDLNGIGSIGDIGAPSIPEILVINPDARPRVVVQSLVPGNAPVNRMELWYSINNTTFELVSTQTPAEGSGSFVVGQAVLFEHVPPDAGTIYYRTRAANSSTSGDYSAVSSAVFTPLQVTDAIGEQTGVLSGGDLLSLLLTIPDLLKGLDVFLDGNPAPPSLSNIPGELANSGFMISADAGQVASATIPHSSSNAVSYTAFANSTFTVPYDGVYKIDVIMDQNTSGAIGGRGADFSEHEDIVRVRYTLFDITGGGNTVISTENSGGVGAFFWTDYAMTGLATLTTTRTYKLEFGAQFYTEEIQESGDISVGWNIYTVMNG